MHLQVPKRTNISLGSEWKPQPKEHKLCRKLLTFKNVSAPGAPPRAPIYVRHVTHLDDLIKHIAPVYVSQSARFHFSIYATHIRPPLLAIPGFRTCSINSSFRHTRSDKDYFYRQNVNCNCATPGAALRIIDSSGRTDPPLGCPLIYVGPASEPTLSRRKNPENAI